MTELEARAKIGFGSAVVLSLALGWAHGLRTPVEVGAAVVAAGVLVPLPAALLGALASVLLLVVLLLPFTLRDGAQTLFDWVAWLAVHAALTFGVVAVVTRVIGHSAPPDLRLWSLVGQLARGAGVLVAGWLALQALREVARRVATALDLRVARGLAHAGQVDEALALCRAGLERWDERPYQRSRAAFELALLRAELDARRDPQEGPGAFVELADELAWFPDLIDRIARAADAAGLPAMGLQAWLLAVRRDPATRERALEEVARRAEALGAADPKSPARASVVRWLEAQVAKAGERRDPADLDALARLAERLGAAALAARARAARS